MQYNELGSTGLRVAPITIGAWQLGGPLFFGEKPDGHPDPGREHVIRMIRELGDLGINAIDTAEQYSAGESERRVGEALAGRRDHWIISTKFGYRVAPDGSREDDSSPGTILRSLEGSLRRLRTDRIDIYLYHCAPDPAALDAGRAVLEKAKAEGKIRCCGISTNRIGLVQPMADRGMIDVLQYNASLLDPQDELRTLALRRGIGTQLRGVMAQGRLSGKYFRQTPRWQPDDNRSDWCSREDFTRFAPLGDLVPCGYTMAQAAIRWALDRPGCHTVCLGAKNIEDYRAAIHALDLPPLSDTVRRELEACAADVQRNR